MALFVENGILLSTTGCFVYDGNKSLYLVFVEVVFSQHLRLLLEKLGQQHLDRF
jgi:hypothetical protein